MRTGNWTKQQSDLGIVVIAMAFTSLIIAACAAKPEPPEGAADVRSELTALQNDPHLAEHAPVEIREADAAVRIAEQPLSDGETALSKHRVYIAERKVAIAEARAATRYAEAQRARLSEERDEARLEARTREVGRARDEASRARSAAEAAELSRKEGAAEAEQRAAEFQERIDALEAEVTDRGVVLTLGDILFATGSAELQEGDNSNLDKLVTFLNDYPERRVQIEGHTDNVGSAEYNQELSRRRAEAVGEYLTQRGIDAQRLSTKGIGMKRPVADNSTATGRQQNRRVEIIIENP